MDNEPANNALQRIRDKLRRLHKFNQAQRKWAEHTTLNAKAATSAAFVSFCDL